MRRQYGYSDRGYRQQRLIGLLLTLFQQVAQLEYKPPATLALVAGMILLFSGVIGSQSGFVIPPLEQACIQPQSILKYGQWTRLLWGPFMHADEYHLFYNMSSLIWKGAQLEYTMGSMGFGLLVAELLLLSNVIYMGLALALMNYMPSMYYSTCAVGFSAVLFGMKVVLNWDSPGTTNIMGIRIPAKYLSWAELFYIQLLTPNASFTGHLAGILAGIIHVIFLKNADVFQRLQPDRPHPPPNRPPGPQTWWQQIFTPFMPGFAYHGNNAGYGGYGGYARPGRGYGGYGGNGYPPGNGGYGGHRGGGYYGNQVFH